MDIILVMCIGILVGRFIVPQGMKKFNERVSMCCTWLLIFAMGMMLGEREGFWKTYPCSVCVAFSSF